MRSNKRSAFLAAVVLALIPAACAVVAVISHRANGPGWIAPNYDVEYTYLLNALRFQQRLPIIFFFQPATTLAVLYAAVIHIAHAVAPLGSADIVEDVWRHPETYIDRIHASLVVLLFSASFAAGVLVWRRTRSISAGVLLQTGLLLLAGIAASAGLIWPEAVLVVVGVLFAAALAVFILDDCSNSRLCIVLGILGAVGIAAKATFAIVTLLPAILSRSRRQLILYVAVLSVATAILIAPILAQIPRFIGFLATFFNRTGDYGGGSAGFDMPAYLHAAAMLVRQNKIPAAVLVLSAVVFFAVRLRTTHQREQPAQLRALGWLTVIELACYALIARQPYPRYLIPAVLLMGVNLVIIQKLLLGVERWRRSAQTIVVVGIVLISTVWIRNTASAVASARSDTADRLSIVDAATSLQRTGAILVPGPWASSPAYAFAVGEYWVGDAWPAVEENVYAGQSFLLGNGYLRTWKEGLGSGWAWPNVNAPLSHAAEELEWRRFQEPLKDHRVIVQGDWDEVRAALQRNPAIGFHVIRRSRLESLLELRAAPEPAK